MPAPPKFLPKKTAKGWCVSVPPSMSADGKRHRTYFESETAAIRYGQKLRGQHNTGMRSGMISYSLALQAEEAEKILKDSGITLPEAARIAVRSLGSAADRETLRDRWKRAMASGETRWSDRYKIDIAKVPRWVPSIMDRPCGTLGRESIEEALQAAGPLSRSTIDARAARVLAVLNFREKHRKTAAISILSPERCGKLLRACETREEIRAVALLLFAGVRPDSEHGEISRLDWSAVGEVEIYLSPDVSKVGDRHVPISRRLARLLRGRPESGPVIPANWKRVWTRIRRLAGITEQDITRHTFASNFLAAHGEEAAKAAMGHTRGSDTLFRHYRRAVTKAAGERFFR